MVTSAVAVQNELVSYSSDDLRISLLVDTLPSSTLRENFVPVLRVFNGYVTVTNKGWTNQNLGNFFS
jgi:hypothetical protein